MNGLTTIESKRRAVAPIIATLLMVAIAVVGGILIFVFTQGFFADEQVVGPTVDNIRITGYDAQDVATGTGASPAKLTGSDTIACSDNAVDNVLNTGDCIVVFVENLGDKPVAIQAVRVFGETHTPGTNADDTCDDTDGEFSIHETATGTNDGISIIEPNTLASICISYDGASGAVKAGRTIPIQVETSNGQSSLINIINGAIRGQQ